MVSAAKLGTPLVTKHVSFIYKNLFSSNYNCICNSLVEVNQAIITCILTSADSTLVVAELRSGPYTLLLAL